jgi:3'(2'), 5'-bisphosphate nucleotidase
MKDYLDTAIQASIEAGIEIMKVYNTAFDVEIKGDDSPLTQADMNANSVIISYLERTEIPIISEENKQIDYSDRKDWNRCWIVDPLDGTKEFVKRNGEFTVNIALIEYGNPILGVIYVPVTRTLYFTGKNSMTSFRIDLSEETISTEQIYSNAKKIKSSDYNQEITKIIGSRSHLNEETKKFISEVEKQRKVEIVSKGSSLKFCMVAEGEAHIYPRFAPTMEWDTAAGQAICEAVGVQVIDNSTQRPLLYNKENLLNPHFLVSK